MARPTVMTDEVIGELEKRFRDGATVLEAIDNLIAESTYYDHLDKNETFSERMELAQEYTTEIARGVVSKRIKKGDVESAKWWLERRAKDKYSTRTENTGKDGKDLPAPTFQVMTNEAKILLESLYERPDSTHD